MLLKFDDVPKFVVIYHPEKLHLMRAINNFEDTCTMHFQKVLRSPKKQVTLDKYFKEAIH